MFQVCMSSNLAQQTLYTTCAVSCSCLLCHGKTCHPIAQGHISSCVTRTYVLFVHTEILLCSTWRHVVFWYERTWLLVVEEGIVRRRILLFLKTTCLLMSQEDMSFFATTNHLLLRRTKTRLLVERDDMSYRATRRRIFV